MAGIRMGLPLPSAGEISVQLVSYALVEDYLSYWLHRFLHTDWGYDKIHHVHHELTAPTSYAHWAEVVVFAVPTFVGPTIAPCHIVTHWLWFVVRILEAINTHCG
jgi:sterol desaturase/sphingolipid hydroxylase (fatty acid hydroxylase superfamily)